MYSGVVLAWLLTAGAGGPAVVKDFALADAAGKNHSPAEWQGKNAVVLLFLGTECPVSNGYAPEYARLVQTFADRGVLIYGVHADPSVSAADARKHAAEYRLRFPVLLDPAQVVARQAGVRIVPTAVVLSAEGRVLYRGRIDDRYSADGKRREEPSSKDLEKAVAAVLDGKSPPAAETKPFGCPLPPPAK